jgi:hypothetical protein
MSTEFVQELKIESRGDLYVTARSFGGYWRTLWRCLVGKPTYAVEVVFTPDSENVHEVAVERAAERDSGWIA